MGAIDELIDATVVGQLARLIHARGVQPRALDAVAGSLDSLKLRRRVDIVRDALLADLPEAYAPTAATIRAAFENEAFTGWMLWPVSEAVVDRALRAGRPDDLDDATDVLARLTTRLSGEFAIRALLNARLERTLDIAQQWTGNENAHVRRLASEGTRAHLPWAKGVPELIRQPGMTRPIVDALYADESEYVRRSVANHVNDISRDAPDLAVEIVAGWLDQPDDNTSRVARHALRTLTKNGHPEALRLMGFHGDDFDVTGPHVLERQVPMGSEVHFTAQITNTGAQAARAAVDFLVHFRKADGALRPKVFKLATRSIAPGETVLVEKSYSFRTRTTRTFHPGEHAIELQINGRRHGYDTFQLVTEEQQP
jgi:3-methyladenine DNA glycosylase AlkC